MKLVIAGDIVLAQPLVGDAVAALLRRGRRHPWPTRRPHWSIRINTTEKEIPSGCPPRPRRAGGP
jgi:uncharacterized protein YaiI (UPF0178 family)